MANGSKWTQNEEDLARKLRARGKSYGEIGLALGRTEASVCQHLRLIQLCDSGRTIVRTGFNYDPGGMYRISQINGGDLQFLPSVFFFLERIFKPDRRSLYQFRSIHAPFLLSFTYAQIVGSYLIEPVERIGPRWVVL